MKKTTKNKVKNITHDIIDFFLSVPEALVRGFDRQEFYRLLQGRTSEPVLSCSNICKIYNNLKCQGYIQVNEKGGGNESIQFTNKAKMAIVDRLASKIPSSVEYCLVSFDIPEYLKRNRNGFRRTIKKMGFKQIQKSLWVSNKKLGHLVELASIEYGVDEYVVYFISNNINITNHIKVLFS